MSGQQHLPLEVDPFRMAEVGRYFAGKIEVGKLKRLLPLLESTIACVDVEIKFDVDEGGVKFLHGKLRATLVLKCQRCLQAMNFPLQDEFRLAFVQSDSEAERLSEQYEPQVVESTPIHLLDLIEDEILLCLTQIPVHDEGVCSVQQFGDENKLVEQQDKASEKPNPFAVLKELKKDH